MKKAFTLLELLIVIATIALLIAVLQPSLAKARDSAKTVVCLNNLKQLATATQMYLNVHEDYPDAYGIEAIDPDASLSGKIKPYLDAPERSTIQRVNPWACPFDKAMYPIAGGSYMYLPFYYRIWYVPKISTIFETVPLLPMIRDHYPRQGKIHIVRFDSSSGEVNQSYAPGTSWLNENRRTP